MVCPLTLFLYSLVGSSCLVTRLADCALFIFFGSCSIILLATLDFDVPWIPLILVVVNANVILLCLSYKFVISNSNL